MQLRQCLPDGYIETVFGFELFFNQMGDNLGVGFALENMTGLFELFFKLQIVFDDSVVYHDDRPGLVRVGVDLGWPAVCSPTGVPDADNAG